MVVSCAWSHDFPTTGNEAHAQTFQDDEISVSRVPVSFGHVAGVNDEILKEKIKIFLIKSFSLSCDLITLQIFDILGSYMNK